LLQIGRACGAVLGASQKHRLQLGVFGVLCCGAKAFFAIFRSFDEII